jgi:hypothetical protein
MPVATVTTKDEMESPLPLWERIKVRGITPILTFPRQGGRDWLSGVRYG